MNLRVGISYNLYDDFPVQENDPADIAIEWCDTSYIELLKNGIQRAGFECIDIGHPRNLMEEPVRKSIDVLFSVAEMRGYRYRESLVPVLCEFYELPYLFARPDGMLITADKQMSNMVVERLGMNVPAWQVIKKSNADLQVIPGFPCIVKPNAEGGSMGIDANSVVHSKEELETKVNQIIKEYKEPALVQQFISGREITVGVIQQDGKTKALSPLEVFDDTEMELIFNRETKQKYKTDQLFKPVADDTIKAAIKFWATQIFDEIGCLDAARIDFRISGDKIYFIEINGLTDFHPAGAFCQSARLEGLSYEQLLKTIIVNAYDRFSGKQ